MNTYFPGFLGFVLFCFGFLKVSLEDQGYDIREGMKIFGEICSCLPSMFLFFISSHQLFQAGTDYLEGACLM